MATFKMPSRNVNEPRFSNRDWRTLVEEIDTRGPSEVSYEFSNGRKFKEPFIPTGGAYE